MPLGEEEVLETSIVISPSSSQMFLKEDGSKSDLLIIQGSQVRLMGDQKFVIVSDTVNSDEVSSRAELEAKAQHLTAKLQLQDPFEFSLEKSYPGTNILDFMESGTSMGSGRDPNRYCIGNCTFDSKLIQNIQICGPYWS